MEPNNHNVVMNELVTRTSPERTRTTSDAGDAGEWAERAKVEVVPQASPARLVLGSGRLPILLAGIRLVLTPTAP
jgi:hypothetical protein